MYMFVFIIDAQFAILCLFEEFYDQGLLSLTWIDFNPSINK